MANIQTPCDETEAETRQCGLLHLPTETWTNIVELAVTEEASLTFVITYLREPIDFKEPPIAKTCRALRTEAMKLFYKKNEFFIDGVCGHEGDEEIVEEWTKERIEEGHWDSVKYVLVKQYCKPRLFRTIPGEMFPGKKIGGLQVERCAKGRIYRIAVDDVQAVE